jgi:hypothetical protein
MPTISAQVVAQAITVVSTFSRLSPPVVLRRMQAKGPAKPSLHLGGLREAAMGDSRSGIQSNSVYCSGALEILAVGRGPRHVRGVMFA